MSSLLGVLKFGRVSVPAAGVRMLGPEDVDVWAETATGTPVHAAVRAGRRLAGHIDRVRVDKGRMFVYGDLDRSLPGGQEALWAITESEGICDRLDAQLVPRQDPLRDLTAQEREVLTRHWGAFPTDDDAGVIVTSVSVSPMGLTPGSQWLGA